MYAVCKSIQEKPVDTGALNEVTSFLSATRAEIRELPLYNSGLSIDFVRKHYGVDRIAKLGSNENPYGPSAKVIAAVANAAAEIGLYPEASCDSLRAVLASYLQVAPEKLIFGNGSEDLISIAVHTFLSPGDRVVTFAPSFGLHVIWPQSVGAEVTTVSIGADYKMDIDQVIAALTPGVRMLLFGNPSNPVGTSITGDDLRRILRHLTPETLVLFDEAYLEYSAADPSYPDFHAVLSEFDIPWLMLRTFSKAYGLAGLRVGYAIASDPELIGLMDRVRAPFNVNRLAQAGAIAALEDRSYVEGVVERTVAERERMRAALEELGYPAAQSHTNFLFFDARGNAAEIARLLLPSGVIVKPWMEPAFDTHIRVSVGSPEANDQFLAAWKALAR
jgi:histidinol-phosphate aminotransferase